MAAGMGSRYLGSKQTDLFTEEGDLIMDFSLYDAWKAGFRRVVFIIRADLEDALRAHLRAGAGKKMETLFVRQELDDLPEGFQVPAGRTKPWGTGQAVLAARSVIDAPFAVINADDYYGPHAFQIIYDYLREQVDDDHYCMVGYRIENTLSAHGTVNRGICRAEGGRLQSVEEHYQVRRDDKGEHEGEITGLTASGRLTVLPEGTLVSMNLWGFSPAYLPVMEAGFRSFLSRTLRRNPLEGEFLLHHAADRQVRAGEASVAVLPTDDLWFGVTYREDKPEVAARFESLKDQGVYPRVLWG